MIDNIKKWAARSFFIFACTSLISIIVGILSAVGYAIWHFIAWGLEGFHSSYENIPVALGGLVILILVAVLSAIFFLLEYDYFKNKADFASIKFPKFKLTKEEKGPTVF